MTTKQRQEDDQLVSQFVQGSVQDKYNALRQLIAQRRHHQAARDTGFQEAVDRLFTLAADETVPDRDRLLAIAVMGRLASTIKRLREEIHGQLVTALQTRLPDPLLLKEPDDRVYIALACEQVRPAWGVAYAAAAVIREEAGEQARVAFFRALLAMQPDLAAAFAALSEPLAGFSPTTEDPGTSVARRLKRIMAAIAAGIADTRIEPGKEPGRMLAELCKAAFRGVAPPKNEEALLETAGAVARVIHGIVRLRFSLATEAATYFALKAIKFMLPAREWESFAAESDSLVLVVEDISEAILILARQGIVDDSLANELGVACGSRKQARKRLKQLTKSIGIPDRVKQWLATGREDAPVDSALSESRQLDEDTILADMLVDSRRYQSAAAVASERILPEIEMLEPRLAEDLERLLRSGLSLCDGIQRLAGRRRLKVRGAPGDEEEYAPLEHELVGGGTGARRVRIIRPVVEQERENGVSFVISKGLVEKVQ